MAREAAGYDTQRKLADELGVTSQTISDVEQDRPKSLGLVRLLKIAAKVKVPLEDLVVGVNTDYDRMRRDLIRQRVNVQRTASKGGPPTDADDVTAGLLENLRYALSAEHVEFRQQVELHVRALLEAIDADAGREDGVNTRTKPATGKSPR